LMMNKFVKVAEETHQADLKQKLDKLNNNLVVPLEQQDTES